MLRQGEVGLFGHRSKGLYGLQAGRQSLLGLEPALAASRKLEAAARRVVVDSRSQHLVRRNEHHGRSPGPQTAVLVRHNRLIGGRE